MLYPIFKIVKWISLPLLLASGPFTRTAGEYEFLLSVAICLGSVIAAGIALRKKEYFLAAGFVSVAVVYSPLILVTKIIVLLSFTGIVTLLTLFAAFRPPAIAAQNDLET